MIWIRPGLPSGRYESDLSVVEDPEPMKHAVMAAHPRLNSFTLAMAQGYAEAAREAGAEVVVRDLYRIGFDPVLHEEELPDHVGFRPGRDVEQERHQLAQVDVFALFYPLWFNAAPAMLKGYVDRVFGLGFGYSPVAHGGNQPLLGGRKLVSFTASGAPQAWVERSGAWAAMQSHFDDHFAAVTGLENLGHHNSGGVAPGIRPDVVARHLATVQARARDLAANPAAFV